METSVRDAGFVTTGDGCRIAWRCDGPADAPVLLLSHSLGTGMDMWAPQLAAWTQRFRVLRYDQRGHGASDAPAGAYSLDRLGRDVVELLDALARAIAGSRLIMLAAAHLSNVEQPDAFARAVLDFLSEA